MKRILFVIFFLFIGSFLTSCKKDFYLRGYFGRDEFIEKCRWKHPVALKYKPDSVYFDSLRKFISKDSADLKLFVGTWCSDSRKWVSRYFNISPYLRVRSPEIISVDTTKEDEKGLAKSWKVDSLPTFIFLRNGKEIGRITEKPYKRKLERQLWRILKKDK